MANKMSANKTEELYPEIGKKSGQVILQKSRGKRI